MNEVQQYISQSEPVIQTRLEILRKLFFEVLPDTEESIRYNMPVLKLVNIIYTLRLAKSILVFILFMD